MHVKGKSSFESVVPIYTSLHANISGASAEAVLQTEHCSRLLDSGLRRTELGANVEAGHADLSAGHGHHSYRDTKGWRMGKEGETFKNNLWRFGNGYSNF